MSTAYYSNKLRSPQRNEAVLDRNDKHFVNVVYIPAAWAANTVYKTGDIVLPTVFKRIAYKVTAAGKSSATEPTWLHTIGDPITDGATFEGIDYFEFSDLDTALTITTSTFTASDGVTLTLPTNTTTTTKVFISAIPATISNFTVTNHTVWSNTEERDFSVLFLVADK